MQYKAIILDLDNTIYPVSAIGYQLFPPLFQLIKNNIKEEGQMPLIEKDIMRKPFQWVAATYGFSDQVTTACLHLLTNLTYDQPINSFPDYALLKQIPCTKFLVTMGFTKMQNSKVAALKIGADFEKIYIIDPASSSLTKKDIFRQIMVQYELAASEVMVIGDDPNAEIKAGQELGLSTFLYDRNHQHVHLQVNRIDHFGEILRFFEP